MDDFDLDFIGDLEAAEKRAKETAERQPDIDEGEADCEGCKI